MSFEAVAKNFTAHYYGMFDNNKRAELGVLYQPNSMLTWEGEQIQGAEKIAQKLQGLPFSSVIHKITTMDAQPSAGSGVLIFVCGNLAVDGNVETPLKFSQTFLLLPIQGSQGGFFVQNDLFRLNYC